MKAHRYRVTLFDKGKKFGPMTIPSDSETGALMGAVRHVCTEEKHSFSLDLKYAITKLSKRRKK